MILRGILRQSNYDILESVREKLEMSGEKYICTYALDFKKKIFQKVQRKVVFIPCLDDS